MNRPASLPSIACALFITLLLAACGPSTAGPPASQPTLDAVGLTPGGVVEQSGVAIQGFASYRVTFSVDGPDSLSYEGEEAYEAQALAYSRLLGNDGSEEVEVLFIPPDLYMNGPDSGWVVLSPWHQGIRPAELSALTDDDALGPDDAFLDYARFAKLVRDPEQLQDEDIDGEPVVHFKGHFNPSKLWPEADSDTVDVDLWLHWGNFAPRRVETGPITDESGAARLTFDFVDYNEPVTIAERPPDAQPVRDLQLQEAPCTGDALAACLQAQAPLSSLASPTCAGAGRRVCLVPLGRVSVLLVEHLVSYYQDEYGLPVTVLPPQPVPQRLINAQRGQADADPLIEYMGSLFPGAYSDPDAVLIGLTPIDVYDHNSHVRYYLSFRRNFYNPKAVISTFRMDPAIYAEPPDEEVFQSRVRKMFTKYLGLLYYGLPPSSDPTSPMFDAIGGPADLDLMGESLPVP